MSDLTIYWSIPVPTNKTNFIQFDELKKIAGISHILKNFMCYNSIELYVPEHNNILNPLLIFTYIRLLSRKAPRVIDQHGNSDHITFLYLLNLFFRVIGYFPITLTQQYVIKRNLTEITTCLPFEKYNIDELNQKKGLFIRSDLTAITDGGAKSHILGVCNALSKKIDKLQVFSTSYFKGIASDVELNVQSIPIWQRCFPKFLEHKNSKSFAYFIADKLRDDQDINFIYQRYSINNTTGNIIANTLKKPLIIEYNGSEVWIRDNWGKGLKNIDLLKKIENKILQTASYITCVSKTLELELLNLGIPKSKILLNPNCVDLNEYRHTVDGEKQYPIKLYGAKRVIGFVGSFGKWHGVHLLVEAFEKVIQETSFNDVHLLLIGTGETYHEISNLVDQKQLGERVSLTGLVEREKIPTMLKSCDVLVSPQVPNKDGSAFFGSPTKLFEYMASGVPIVASDLDQIGEILSHEKNALLFKPNDINSMAEAIRRILNNPELAQTLSENAFDLAAQEFTWEKHVERIFTK